MLLYTLFLVSTHIVGILGESTGQPVNILDRLFGTNASVSQPGREHRCIHDTHIVPLLEPHWFAPNASGDHVSKRQASVQAAPIRVHWDTSAVGNDAYSCRSVGNPASVEIGGTAYSCDSQYVVTNEIREQLMVKVLPAVAEFVSSLLAVKPVQGNLRLKRDSCGFHHPMSTSRYRGGSSSVPADIVLFVTTWPASSGVAAWAGSCESDEYGRPIAGHVNFNPSAMAGESDRYIARIAVHEIFHALGFNGYKMDSFLSSSGVRIRSGDVVEEHVLGSGKTAQRVKTANVVAEARAHYGCPSLTGLELEEFRRTGAIGSHWERRVVNTEMMSPVASGYGAPVSAMTLAFFKDMGVYFPDMRQAEPLPFGRGAGCWLLQDKCTEWRDTYALCPESSSGNVCSGGRDGYASCRYYQYQDCLPAFMQTTSDCRKAGDQYLDGCPVVTPYVSCDLSSPGTYSARYGEQFGTDAYCVESSVIERGWSSSPSARCMRMRCNRSGNSPSSPSTPTTPTGASSCSTASSCGACGERSGCSWCDYNFGVAGVCQESSDQCPAQYVPVLRGQQCPSTSQSYGSCSAYGRSGQCVTADYCLGDSPHVSSSSGADGCQPFASSVKCCVPPAYKKKRQVTPTVEVQVGTTWHTCPSGSVLSLGNTNPSFSGTIECPPVDDICCENDCSGRGRCVNGVCACEPGYYGDSCASVRPSPDLTVPNWGNPNIAFALDFPVDFDGSTLAATALNPELVDDMATMADDQDQADVAITAFGVAAGVLGLCVCCGILLGAALLVVRRTRLHKEPVSMRGRSRRGTRAASRRTTSTF